MQYPYEDSNGLHGAYIWVRVGSGLQCRRISLEPLKEPSIGITIEEVRKSTWGEPKQINKTTSVIQE